MKAQPSRLATLEQIFASMHAWLHAFDSDKLGVIDVDKYQAFLGDLYGLEAVESDVSRWVEIPYYYMEQTGEKLYDYAVFGIKLRSLVTYLGAELEREKQAQAVAGGPLSDDQLDLLRTLVGANRNVAAVQRQEIVGISADGETRFFHPGLPERSLTPNMTDLRRLTQLGLIKAYDRGGRQGWVIEVLTAGQAAIDALQSANKLLSADVARQRKLPDEFRYHVAISYAGPDMQHAEDLATLVEQDGYKVFFDKAKPAEVWGKNLHSYLQEVFAEQALYCVLFISEEYKNREWTNKELHDALDRQMQLRGSGEYILPIQLNKGVKLDGLPPSIAYLSIDDYTIEKVRDFLVEKIDSRVGT